MTDQSVKILDAALRLYMTKPPHKVSVEEIASEAGVSKSLIFYHFESKQKLLEETLIHAFRMMISDFNPKSIEELIDYGLEFIRERREFLEFAVYALSFVNPERFENLFDEAIKKVIPLFKEFKYPREVAIFLMAMLDGLSLYSLYFDIGSVEKYRKIAVEFVESCGVKA